MKYMKSKELSSDVKPVVEDYQAPRSAYSQDQFGKTTEYVARQDKTLSKEARKVDSQDYKGRYS